MHYCLPLQTRDENYENMPINQPSNQIKLTNVSVVRYKRSGKRFEIACYKNKVLEWRAGTEKDIDEVLQISSIFSNVSKGALASSEDIQKAFPSITTEAIIAEILKKGDLQVSDKERGQIAENTIKDIIQIITDKTIDPASKRPYTTGMIEKALLDIGFSVNQTKSPKSQALDAIKLIQEKGTIPLTRALMKLRVSMPVKEGKSVRDSLRAMFVSIDVGDEIVGPMYEITGSIQPGEFRKIGDLVRETTRGRGQVEVLDFSQVKEGDETFT